MKRVLALVSVLFALGAPVHAAVLTPLDPVLVDNTYISVSGSQTADITFINQTSFAVDLYWIDYSGNRVFYSTIVSGATYIQATFITHPWLVVQSGTGSTTQGSGQLITAFTAVTPNPASPAVGDTAYIAIPQTPIPTLGDYALGGLAILLGIGGAYSLNRRRKSVAD